MDPRRAFIIAACLAFGLAGCYAPLEREHGYPDEWPDPTALSKGFPEINGTYANNGTLFSTDAGFGGITLASLIPEQWTSGKPNGGVPVPNPPCMDCVVLRIRPGTKWSPYPKLQATIPAVEGAREFDVEVLSDESLLLYALKRSTTGGGFLIGGGQTNISLTVAGDRSLIAKIQSEDLALIVVVPYYSAKYAWARFERIGD